MTQRQLSRLGLGWQRRLRLQDWEVEYSFNPHSEIDADAMTEFNPQLKCARIKVCTKATRVGACTDIQPYDPEQFLVHELLHLHWHFLNRDSPELTSLETAIYCTAWALVRALRDSR